MIHLTKPDKDGNPQSLTLCGKPNGPDVKWRKSRAVDCPDCIKCRNAPPGEFKPERRRKSA